MLFALVGLLLLTLLGLPGWPYSRRWTYYPSAVCGLAAVTLVLLVLSGRL